MAHCWPGAAVCLCVSLCVYVCLCVCLQSPAISHAAGATAEG